jgi:hypothetical protein
LLRRNHVRYRAFVPAEGDFANSALPREITGLFATAQTDRAGVVVVIAPVPPHFREQLG